MLIGTSFISLRQFVFELVGGVTFFDQLYVHKKRVLHGKYPLNLPTLSVDFLRLKFLIILSKTLYL